MKQILLLFCLFVINIYAKEENLEKIKLQLQWKHQFEFAGFYAAKEKGFYKEVGLDVEFIESDLKKNIVDEVLNKNVHYGLEYSSFIVDYLKGKPLVFISNFFKQSPFVLVTQKNIFSPADLKGKKVMGLLENNHKQTILTMLGKFNITPNDIINIPQKEETKNFIDKKIDAMSVYKINEIYILNNLKVDYNIFDPAFFGTRFYDLNLFTSKDEAVNNPKRVENFRKASIKGWEYALAHKEELVNIILNKYNTQNKSKEALIFEANEIEKLMLTDIYPIGSIDLDVVQSIANNFAQSLFLPKISKEKLEKFVYKSEKYFIEFTKEEKKYLEDKKNLIFCVDPNWLPLEKIENGKYIGVGSEFIDIISQSLNIPIKLLETKSWNESLEKIKARDCDFLPFAQETPKRKKYLNFTSSFLTFPLVIVTKNGLPFIDNLKNLEDKELAVVKDYSIVDILKEKYPNLNLIEVSSVNEGLSFVQREKVFGLLDNSFVVNHEIQKNNMGDISITGQLQESYYLSIASRNDEPILNDIMQKILLIINDETKKDLLTKWNNIKYQNQIDYQLIIQIIFLGLVLIGIFIYWNLKLKESEEKFRTLFDIAPIFLNSFDKNGKITLWNKECEKIFGWTYDEIKKEKEPLSLFYDDPIICDKVLKSFKAINSIFEEWHPKTKDGKILTVKWANVKLPNGEIIHIGVDITQQRKYEISIQEKALELKLAKLELEDLNSSLEKRITTEIEKNTKQQLMIMQQNKLVQMGEMIKNIAHQWRQPLAQINSSIILIDAMLDKYNFKDSIVENKLTEIESLTSYMSKTINDFRNFFNPNKKKINFKVEEAIQKASDVLKGLIHTHYIEMEINIEKNLIINSYLGELQQVVLIILNNAIDALIIANIQNPKIIVESYTNNENIIINIEDNALGINSDILDKIFEPYFTTKYKAQGTGLGLYIAKMIVENSLLGTLNVENRVNGACFIIKIPKGKV